MTPAPADRVRQFGLTGARANQISNLVM